MYFRKRKNENNFRNKKYNVQHDDVYANYVYALCLLPKAEILK